MKIVKEQLYEKFFQEGDPIRDMGIGIKTETIVKKIVAEDNKHHLIQAISNPGNINKFVVTAAVGRNKQHLTGSYFKIIFWSDEFFKTLPNGKKKRMMFKDKAAYADQLIKDAGFEDFFSDYNWDPHDKGVVNFRIKPEFRGYFKPGHYPTQK